MNEITVLTTACGSAFMPGFFNCLHNNGERKIKIIGVDVQDEASIKYLVDQFYVVPPYHDNCYIECLVEICKKERVDIFFPQISMELELVQQSINDFTKIDVKVAMCNTKTLETANNKLKLYEFMKKIKSRHRLING